MVIFSTVGLNVLIINC